MEAALFLLALGLVIVLGSIVGTNLGTFLKERRERILRGE